MNKSRDSYIIRKWEEARQSRNRRSAPRYSPQGCVPVCLGWVQGGEYQYTQGEVINISVTGVLLQAVDRPPDGQPVWVRLEEPNPTDWVEAAVVGVERPTRRSCLVRMAFREGCPYPVFKAVVNGFHAQHGMMSLPQDLKSPQWW